MEVVSHQNSFRINGNRQKVTIQNLFRCCVTVFGPLGRVLSLSPLGVRDQGV
jgi:hypothetical protein